MKLHIEGLTDKFKKVYFKVSVEDYKGVAVVKTVGYETLVKMLNSSYRVEKESVSIGKLPEGYLDAKVNADGSGVVRVYVPEAIRCFLLDVGEKIPKGIMIPMPSMVFEISISNTGSYHGKTHMVKGTYEKVKEDYYEGRLKEYDYPFGHVHLSGDICMVSVELNIGKISEASQYVDAFFDGVTNADYVGTESRVKNRMKQMELLDYLKGKKKFPYEILKESAFPFMKKTL